MSIFIILRKNREFYNVSYNPSVSLHTSLQAVKAGLSFPREDKVSLSRQLAYQFVELSTAVRDFTIECTYSPFAHDDIRTLRNLLQGVIRAILVIKPDKLLHLRNPIVRESDFSSKLYKEHKLVLPSSDGLDITSMIRRYLEDPTQNLIDSMMECIIESDAYILSPQGKVADKKRIGNLGRYLMRLRCSMEDFDRADSSLIADPKLPSTYIKIPDVIKLLLFVHPLRQAADKVDAFVAALVGMQKAYQGWYIQLPSYPLKKAVSKSNAQVRHDRGGLTAGFYFRSKGQLDRMMATLQSSAYIPAGRPFTAEQESQNTVMGEYQQEQFLASGKQEGVSKRMVARYRFWEVLHRLQGFESRFAFKVSLVTTLLSIPAWLIQSQTWWNDHRSWWAVVTVWMMMHPRVGGTFQDLFVRSFCAALGALWGGLAYAADDANPYVIAIFAAIFMIPMLYRFTQSSHPRSGIVGCVSFTVVSLGAYTEDSKPSITMFAWTQGLAFVVGVVAALITNWILWPFVARHELRESISAMLLHSSILYRGVVAKYIYYNPGCGPEPSDIARSELLEGRLREGFVRMRQLMEMTRHEMRLRAPFDPLPYSALIASCESFFEHLVQIRQSSLYFQPEMRHGDAEEIEKLKLPRRDAVAVIMMNLYVLATALREGKEVPRYLPSAAVARRKLLDLMEDIEAARSSQEHDTPPGASSKHVEPSIGGENNQESQYKGKEKEEPAKLDPAKGKRWAEVYQYAFSTALTDIVEELQDLQRYIKEICGEVRWECVEEDEDIDVPDPH